jgi:16S rRNA C967 or C1407 C5-methylase (RsmB/RsmF family)/NOL1/NOP2/fmu family ribosome biogenesis protein
MPLPLPPEFIRSLAELPGCDPTALVRALDGPSPVSIRFNPFKVSEKPRGDGVPWCRYGFYLDERPAFTLDPALHGGAYYVQEAGSMFVEHLMRGAFPEGCDGLRILDLCASPGGKTTLLSTLAGLDGAVVANETVRGRIAALVDNVTRWGLGNVAVTHSDPAALGAFRDIFDAVLVDAPCSGEGMFRKDPAARAQWSAANVELCAARQRRILADVWPALRPDGVLIYSTCTFDRAENEDNVRWMIDEFGAEGVAMPVERGWGVVESRVGEAAAFRFYPDKTRSEGFFAAVVRKPGGKVREKMPAPRAITIAAASKTETAALSKWVEQPEQMSFSRVGDEFYGYFAAQAPFMRQLAERLAVVHSGVPMGQLFHGELRPAHALALFTGLDDENFNVAELSEEAAVAYLRKADADPELFAEGLDLVRANTLPIGWAKRIGGRVNNMYPKGLRIIKSYP